MIRAALAAIALAVALPAQLELIPTPDFRQWTLWQSWLQAPIIAQTQSRLSVINPSFSRASYVEIRSPEFAILAKIGNEPRPKLRVVSTMSAVLGPHASDSIWIAIHDGPTGARLGITQHKTSDERLTAFVAIPDQSPYPPISRVQVRYTVRLAPRQTWSITGISANRTHGPGVIYRAGPNVVSAKVERSSFGGNPMGVIWSQTVRSQAIPLAGFSGTGLIVGGPSYLVFFVPLQPIISPHTALISFIRAGRWQAIETTPVPALGWALGG